MLTIFPSTVWTRVAQPTEQYGQMLGVVFAYEVEKAYGMAKEVDTSGRVIVLTTHKERAELKRDQILAYGADPRMERSHGSMRAIIEPAEG